MLSSERIIRNYLTDIPDSIILKNKVSGTINEADDGDRTVWAYNRNDGELIGATIVNRDTRQWELYTDPNYTDESITLICRDESGNYNGDIFDRVSLCAVEHTYPPGIMGHLSYPNRTILNYTASAEPYNKYCSVELPELKGDIAKVIGTGTYSDGYIIKYVNSSGSEINNDVTLNNVTVNDDAVILNKQTRAYTLKSWRKDIFGDGSEVFHPVWNGSNWVDYYSNAPCESPTSVTCENDSPLLTAGFFDEAAICVSSKNIDRYSFIAQTGPRFYLYTENLHAVTVSFWVHSAGLSNNYQLAATEYQGVKNVLNVCNRFGFQLYHNKLSVWANGTSRTNCLIWSNNNTVNSGIIEYTNNFEGGLNSNNFPNLDKKAIHVVMIYTPVSLDLYIDNVLLKTITYSTAQDLPKHGWVQLGKAHTNSNYSDQQWVGSISGLRIFNRVVSDEEVSILYNDRPVLEAEVNSVKGMEHDSGLISLGGIPYKPSISQKVQTIYNGTVKLSNFSTYALAFNMLDDCVQFTVHSSTSGAYTGLSSRVDNVSHALGFNLNNIDIYMRVFIEGPGYLFNIGNANNSVFLYASYRNAPNALIAGYGTRRATLANAYTRVKDMWIRIKWIGNTIYIYDDNEEEILYEYTISNFSVPSATTGLISVGCQRGGSTWDKPTWDIYGGVCRVSDFYIYERGRMGIDEPLKKYEFGSLRNGYAGLHSTAMFMEDEGDSILENHSIHWSKMVNLLDDRPKTEIQKDFLNEDGGYSFITALYPTTASNNTSDNRMYLFTVDHVFGVCSLTGAAHIRCSTVLNSSENIETYSNNDVYENSWRFIGCSVDYKANDMVQYSQGSPLTCAASLVDIYPSKSTSLASGNIVINAANLPYKIAFLNMYGVVLPPSMFRNAYQNYFNECYKDEMLVAFIEENTDYPIYANTLLTKINIEGLDNGQVLTFACTKNNIDYYIFTTEWKKILTKEGNFWMYWDGSIWQNGGIVKWKAASLAMDIPANRMSLQKINSLNTLQLNTLHDLNNGTFNLAVGMKSDGTISPYIDKIVYNNEGVWLSPVYDLKTFKDTKYITKAYLYKIMEVGASDGIKMYVHKSGELGWQECQNFQEVPGIIKNTDNEGTIQFKITFDQSKDNFRDKVNIKVTIK